MGSADRVTQSGSLVGRMKWQENSDGCAMPVRFTTALNVNPPPVSLDKLLCDEEPDPCADRSPGREEGVKNPWQIRRCNSHSIIFNRQDNAALRSRSIADGKRESSSTVHGIDGVRD